MSSFEGRNPSSPTSIILSFMKQRPPVNSFFDALAFLEPNQVRPKSLKSLKSPKLLKITKTNNHKNFTISAKLSGEANKGGYDLIKVVQRWEIYDFFHFQCGSFSVLCVEVLLLLDLGRFQACLRST